MGVIGIAAGVVLRADFQPIGGKDWMIFSRPGSRNKKRAGSSRRKRSKNFGKFQPAKVDTVEDKLNFFYGPYRKDLIGDSFGEQFSKIN